MATHQRQLDPRAARLRYFSLLSGAAESLSDDLIRTWRSRIAGVVITKLKWLSKYFDERVEGLKILLINRGIYHLLNQVIASYIGRVKRIHGGLPAIGIPGFAGQSFSPTIQPWCKGFG